METLPPELVAYTGMDALTHALEAYIVKPGNFLSDELALNSAKKIFDNIIPAYEGDLNAKYEMLQASTIAGLAFGNY